MIELPIMSHIKHCLTIKHGNFEETTVSDKVVHSVTTFWAQAGLITHQCLGSQTQTVQVTTPPVISLINQLYTL